MVRQYRERQKYQLTSILLRLFAPFPFLFRIDFFKILCLDGLGKIITSRHSGFWNVQNINNYIKCQLIIYWRTDIWRNIVLFCFFIVAVRLFSDKSHIACVASVSVGFGSKERPRNGFSVFCPREKWDETQEWLRLGKHRVTQYKPISVVPFVFKTTGGGGVAGGGGVEGGGLLAGGGGITSWIGGADTGRFVFDIETCRSSTWGIFGLSDTRAGACDGDDGGVWDVVSILWILIGEIKGIQTQMGL